jgi:transcriptional regulator with GAF, ATPase, and Fis domain
LPHDTLTLGLMNEALTELTLYAHTGEGSDLPTVSPQPYPPNVTRAWNFDILDDRITHPLDRDRPATRLGMRSSVRLPIRFGDRLIGGLAFNSAEPSRYSGFDVAVGRRLADHVATALSHHTLAEEGRRAAVLRERALSLEMLDGLLNTLTGVLDIRDVVSRVSAVAQSVLPHDALSIAEWIDGGARMRVYASHGLGAHAPTFPRPEDSLTQPWQFRIVDDLHAHSRYAGTPSVLAGMHSMLSVPVAVEDLQFGSLSFFARAAARYAEPDVLSARRVADHIALALSHQRLAEEARLAVELRSRAEKSDLLDEVLASVTECGTLPEVFDRVSNATQKVLPHDAMLLAARLGDGTQAKVYASKTPDGVKFPDVIAVPPVLLANPDWEYDIVDDLAAAPDQQHLWTAQHGYRSTLRVPIRLDNTFVGGVSFVSYTPGYYKPADVAVARRIAERVALSFARERGATLLKQADEASARVSKLESRVRALTEELDARTGYRRVVGDSVEWRQVLTQATQVASTETTVLLLGESGTGKEVVARFLHRASARNHGPFVALNCAALPEQLLEAELFGYERGAYTGAVQSKPGQLEQAAGGTLFLDEVGEMSPSAQAKFLRVLQEREFQRLGGTRVLRTDARIVAATNRDLQKAIVQEQFREDLYYRLNVFAIRLPPLRDRRGDIVPLSESFLAEICRGLGRPPAGISRDARTMLMEYHWPGNVRELRNILERAAILCDGGLITGEHLALNVIAPTTAAAHKPSSLVVAAPPAAATSRDLQSVEREMIEQALQNARYNKSKAAKALGLSRQRLYLRMRKYGLD